MEVTSNNSLICNANFSLVYTNGVLSKITIVRDVKHLESAQRSRIPETSSSMWKSLDFAVNGNVVDPNPILIEHLFALLGCGPSLMEVTGGSVEDVYVLIENLKFTVPVITLRKMREGHIMRKDPCYTMKELFYLLAMDDTATENGITYFEYPDSVLLSLKQLTEADTPEPMRGNRVYLEWSYDR